MTEFECRICGKFVKSDTSHKQLYEHLREHTKEELIPKVGWWIIN